MKYDVQGMIESYLNSSSVSEKIRHRDNIIRTADKILRSKINSLAGSRAKLLYSHYLLDVDDLTQECLMLVQKVLDTYRLDKGTKFLTYYFFNVRRLLNTLSRRCFFQSNNHFKVYLSDLTGGDEGYSYADIIADERDIELEIQKKDCMERFWALLERKDRGIIQSILNKEKYKVICKKHRVSMGYVTKTLNRAFEVCENI